MRGAEGGGAGTGAGAGAGVGAGAGAGAGALPTGVVDPPSEVEPLWVPDVDSVPLPWCPPPQPTREKEPQVKVTCRRNCRLELDCMSKCWWNQVSERTPHTGQIVLNESTRFQLASYPVWATDQPIAPCRRARPALAPGTPRRTQYARAGSMLAT